jgi:DNA-3-methyladenine glycosylase II
VRIRGIGKWTAEMFLIFYLNRPDVLPLADLGLLKAIQLHYGSPSKSEILSLSQRWQPYRTVSTWYLWRSLDPVIVQY